MMRHVVASQDEIVRALKDRIGQVLARPGMYSRGPDELRGILSAYVDALAIACSGYRGGFLYGDLPAVDRSRTRDENATAIVAAVREILGRSS